MTDRYKGFIVHLDKDIREDDCEEIMTALRMIKRVRDVKPLIADLNDDIAYMRGRGDVLNKISSFISDIYIKELHTFS